MKALKYSPVEASNADVEFFMDEMSSDDVADYFYIENQREHNTLYVKTKSSPLRIDKPEMNFLIGTRVTKPAAASSSSSSSASSFNVVDDDDATDEADDVDVSIYNGVQKKKQLNLMNGDGNGGDGDEHDYVSPFNPSITRVNIKVMDSSGRSMSKQPSFKSPALAHYFLNLNLSAVNNEMESAGVFGRGSGAPNGLIEQNRSFFELQATSPIGSIISYRLVNGNNTPFHIENNMIGVSREALYSKFLRNSYLVILKNQ